MKKVFISITLIIFSFITYGQHVVILNSGEKLNGEVKSLENGKLIFLLKGNTMNFNITDIESVQFSNKKTMADNPAEDESMKNITYELTGRHIVKAPVIENLTQKKGIVVVSVSVDKYGHITKAEAGAEGTNTVDAYLLTKAKQASESALFDNCPKCPLDSKGTITITF